MNFTQMTPQRCSILFFTLVKCVDKGPLLTNSSSQSSMSSVPVQCIIQLVRIKLASPTASNRYSKPHAWNWKFAQLKQVGPQLPTHLPGWSIVNCFRVLIGSVIPVGIHDHIHHPSVFVFLVKLLLELRHRGRPQNNGPPSSHEMMPKKNATLFGENHGKP